MKITSFLAKNMLKKNHTKNKAKIILSVFEE